MAKVVERHYINEDENFSVYKQANSKRWYARFRLDEWYSKATGETDLQKAMTKAMELRIEYRTMLKNNFPIKSRKTKKLTFKAISDLAITRMENAIENSTGKVVFADYIAALGKYLNPYFGKMNIRDVVEAKTLLDFDAWRVNELGRNPAKSTILTHNSAMQRVLDEAVIQKYITASELPVLKNTGAMGERRAAFTKDEYRKILEKAEEWIEEGSKAVTRNIRLRLYYYIRLAALTGLRPGTEIDNLTWNDAQFKEKEVEITINDKVKVQTKTFLTFTVRKGKTTKYTGTREIVSRRELWEVVQEMALKLRVGKWKYSDKIFGNTTEFGRNFNLILNELSLKKNAHGERSLYSLRHSYITWALEKKTDIQIIADQCGTSVQMIEQHYKHTNPMMFAEELS